MSSGTPHSNWFTEQQVMVLLALIMVVLTGMVFLPYIQYIVFAGVLAYVFWPLRERLVMRFRKDISALAITGFTIIIISLPLLYLLRDLGRQAVSFAETVEETELNYASIEETLLDWGLTVDIEEVIQENQDLIADGFDMITSQITSSVQSLPSIIIGLVILNFVLFVLLRDGKMLVQWTRAMLPIRKSTQSELFTRLDHLMWASVVGNIAAGAIQAIAMGAVFWFLGFENVLFLTVLTFVLALLPLVGAFAVWVPAVGYLMITGQLQLASIMIVFGLLISASDFYTRPLVIGHSAELNSAVIVIGVFGGIVAFGPVGLVVGPVIIGGGKIIIEVMIATRNRDKRGWEAS